VSVPRLPPILLNMSQLNSSKKQKQMPKGKKQTPSHEKMNSTQKRKGTAKLSVDSDGRHGGKTGSFDANKHLLRWKSLVTRKRELDQRVSNAKLPVWDHLKRIPTTVDSKGNAVGEYKRFQTYSEWKNSVKPESNLTAAIKCDHDWRVDLKDFDLRNAVACGSSKAVICGRCHVSASQAKDEKDIQSDDLKTMYDLCCQQMEELRTMFRAAFREGNGNRPMETHLVFDEVVTSATNATLNPAFRIRPSDASTEYNFFAGLFDEYKCIRSHFDFFIQRNNTPTTTSNTPAFACAYDPVDNTVYTAVASALVAAQKIGPIQFNLTGAIPVPENRSGFWRFEAVMPKGPQIEVASAASPIATGCWQDCQITAVDYGYYKCIVPALGNSVTASVWGYIDMTVLFRCRT